MWDWALMVQINDASFCKEAVTGVKKKFLSFRREDSGVSKECLVVVLAHGC